MGGEQRHLRETPQPQRKRTNCISTAGQISDSFTAGTGYTALAREGTDGSGAWDVTVNPEYRIVSATGSYAADGTLSPAELWAAAIVTCKAAVTTLSGTVYTDEGTTPIADGTTIRLLVNGTDAGSATTSAGAYTITSSSLAAGDPILVYIDSNGGTQGVAVTVSDGNSLAGLDIYGNHTIARHDNSGSLTNADMKTAKGSFSDADIDFSVDVSNKLTVSYGTNELYIPTGHSFTPGVMLRRGIWSPTAPLMVAVGRLKPCMIWSSPKGASRQPAAPHQFISISLLAPEPLPITVAPSRLSRE